MRIEARTWKQDVIAAARLLVPDSQFDNIGMIAVDAALAAHECAHWMVASHQRRSVCCFGLGSPTAGHSECPRIVSHEFADREEARASVLGIALLSAFDFQEFAETLNDHNWVHETNSLYSAFSDDVFVGAVEWLSRRGMWPADRALRSLNKILETVRG